MLDESRPKRLDKDIRDKLILSLERRDALIEEGESLTRKKRFLEGKIDFLESYKIWVENNAFSNIPYLQEKWFDKKLFLEKIVDKIDSCKSEVEVVQDELHERSWLVTFKLFLEGGDWTRDWSKYKKEVS